MKILSLPVMINPSRWINMILNLHQHILDQKHGAYVWSPWNNIFKRCLSIELIHPSKIRIRIYWTPLISHTIKRFKIKSVNWIWVWNYLSEWKKKKREKIILIVLALFHKIVNVCMRKNHFCPFFLVPSQGGLGPWETLRENAPSNGKINLLT